MVVNYKVLYLLSSFEIQMSDMSGRAFYPLISRINHSCMPNLAHANIYHIDNNYNKQNQNGKNGIYHFVSIVVYIVFASVARFQNE